VLKLDEGTNKMDKYDPKKVARDTKGRLAIAKIMQYSEISLRLTLSKGSYIIVPSTKNAGDYGKYYLNLFFRDMEIKKKY